MKRALFLVALLALCSFLTAQESNWHVYRPGNIPSSLAYRDNELWVSSGAGIMRWNPASGEKFQFSEDNGPALLAAVKCLYVCQNGDVWAGCGDGALRFDGTNWQQYDFTNSILAPQAITAITEDQNGAVWMGNTSHVYKFDNGTWTDYNSSNSALSTALHVHDMAVDTQNRVWIADWDGAWCFDGTDWTHYTSANSPLSDYDVE